MLVMGAGAVGSYYGALLARAGHRVTLIARGPHLDALRAAGAVAVREADGSLWHANVAAEAQPRREKVPDLAIITTKSHHTAEAARALAPALGRHTLVLSLQNGVENVERAEGALGAGPVLAGQAFVGVWIDAPGTVTHGAEGHVSVGDPSGGITPRARRLHDMVGGAWDVALAEDIVRDQWRKLLWNAGFNAICAVTGRAAGEVLAVPEGAATVREAMHEVVRLAASRGIALTGADVDEMARPDPELASYHPSTSRDLAAGKPLERDALCGFVARDGRARGIPTPVNGALDALLGLLEARARRGSGSDAGE